MDNRFPGLLDNILFVFLLQVYLDFGLAIPKLSVHGMISSVKELLELAPLNKVTVYTVQIIILEYCALGIDDWNYHALRRKQI